MSIINKLLENNKQWAEEIKQKDPNFFLKLSKQQKPNYLWIGCSDSRVPANQIVGLLPGELFVHRNIGNQVIYSDLNCLSVIHFAVEVLKIKNIIICGHYGCGAIEAAIENKNNGFIDNWLKHIKDLIHLHKNKLDNKDLESKTKILCELNVREQVINIGHNPLIQKNWEQGNDIKIYGLIYDIKDGTLRKIIEEISNNNDIERLIN
ncbi:MAG: carbonate dehydratase [Bacteroidetes bacterium]|nr:carbonate dehydratase [Bacteroidota bacterium]